MAKAKIGKHTVVIAPYMKYKNNKSIPVKGHVRRPSK